MADATVEPRSRKPVEATPAGSAAGERPPRTDLGTIILHWTTGVALFVSLLTGIRIAADDLNTPVSHWLSPILPQGEVWTWHFLAGLALFFCGSAYAVYVLRSGLARRNSLKKVNVLAMPAPARIKWGAVNVVLHWALYALIVVLTATGIILYIGYGNWWDYIHSVTAFVALGYIFVHVLTHYFFGGWQQLFRVFRPAPLAITALVRPKPLLIAAAAGVAFAAIVAASDWLTRDTLFVARVQQAPKEDGTMSDPAWSRARPVFIQTQQGGNLGGTGESMVEVRALRDAEKIYFAFRWEDPTRSLRRIPIIKKEDGWYALDVNAGRQDASDYYEDKISVIFSDNPSLGGSGATSLGSHPLPDDKPRPINERGFHFTTDGSLIDMWQFKASRGGLLGHVDSQYIGPPYEPSKDEANYDARYQGGYWNKPGRAIYSYNFKFIRKDHVGPITVVRLPKDLKTQIAALGKYDLDPNSNDDESGRWFMYDTESEPYTAEADAKIPVGTILPGVIISGKYEGERAEVDGWAKWKEGHWTLELVRNLKAAGKFGKDFVPGHDLYMWVAVFDHTQTRHTVHSRAVRIVTEP